MELYIALIAALIIVSIQFLYFNSFNVESGKINKQQLPVTKSRIWIFAALLYAGGMGYILYLILNLIAEF
ncbi:MAG: hypothetical protein ACM3RX_00655 [Methanococcaceae archaeon]